MLNLRILRKRCGLTMKELGSVLGVAESTISQYETGKRQPDYETLLRLGEYFGVSIDYLLGSDAKKEPSVSNEGLKITEDDIKAAFWGGEKELSQETIDALWDDVKAYAAFKAAQARKKKD